MTAMVQEKPVILREAIDPDLPRICADKKRVRQIMLNLLSNAAKFTESGQIMVQAHVVEAMNPPTGQLEPFVEIRVSDTGIGMDVVGAVIVEELDLRILHQFLPIRGGIFITIPLGIFFDRALITAAKSL
jgi:nitrogen-specific signal transduction histidine kinase